MPFSPSLTMRPSLFQVCMPATCVAVGRCKAPTHYPCFEDRHDPLSLPSALWPERDDGAKVVHLGPRHVQVALPSGGQLLVPEWMLDDDLCHGMEIVERPTLAITALVSLRDLIDAQPRTPEPACTIASDASLPGGASDEPTPPGSSSLEILSTQELPQATQQRCRELLTHLLLAAVNTISTDIQEERDERENQTESH